MSVPFHSTGMGRKFYEYTLPELIKALNRVASSLDKYSEALQTEKGVAILSLPDHLRRSVKALYQLGGKGTAEEVSNITKISRAPESGYLNQLVNMGLVEKKPGKPVVFRLKIQEG